MGRRLVGGVLVALGLLSASLAWIAFSVTRTVLDAERSQAIADDVYDDPEVRRQLTSSMASGLLAAMPDGIDVNRLEVEAAASRALEDPAVEDLLIGGIVQAHQRFLGEGADSDAPIVVDGSALAESTRTALVNSNPELVGVVPAVPSISVELPTDSIPDASGLRTTLLGAVGVFTTAAVGLVGAAFVVTDNRARILRRVGFWAIGAAAFWLVIGLALPALAHLLLPGQAAILASIWGVAAGGMLEPSIRAAVAGAAAVVLSVVWMGVSALVSHRRRRAARRPDPRREQITPVEQTPGHRPPPRAPARVPPAPTAPPRPGTTANGAQAPAAPGTAPVRTPGPATPAKGVPVAPSPRPAPKWVEGVGYVDDPDATRY